MALSGGTVSKGTFSMCLSHPSSRLVHKVASEKREREGGRKRDERREGGRERGREKERAREQKSRSFESSA
jgi:hypothetical protein